MYIWVSTERPQCCCCGRFLGWWNKNPTCGECYLAAQRHWQEWDMEQQMVDQWHDWHEYYDKAIVTSKKSKKKTRRWVPKHLQ